MFRACFLRAVLARGVARRFGKLSGGFFFLWFEFRNLVWSVKALRDGKSGLARRVRNDGSSGLSELNIARTLG